MRFEPDEWAIRRGTRAEVVKGGKNRFGASRVKPIESLKIHGLPWMQDGECRCVIKPK